MNVYDSIGALARYAARRGLAQPCDRTWLVNRLLEIMALDDWRPGGEEADAPLCELLETLVDDAVSRGLCEDNITARDLFDTKLMGALTPAPHEVRERFRAALQLANPEKEDRFRGGALADHPHLFDLIRYITGSEFSEVYAEVSPNIREGVETEDMIRIIGRLENGVCYSVDPSYANNEEHVTQMIGMDWNQYPRCVEVFMTAVGTKGVIIADLYGKTYCFQRQSNGKYAVGSLGSSGLWNRRTEEFYHCIRDGKKPTVGLREHRNSILTMNAAYESVSAGKVIHLQGGTEK